MAVEDLAGADLAYQDQAASRTRSLGGERRTRAGGMYRLGEAADVVGAVMAAAVDDERGRTGDVAEVGALDVLGNAVTHPVRLEFIAEAVDVRDT